MKTTLRTLLSGLLAVLIAAPLLAGEVETPTDFYRAPNGPPPELPREGDPLNVILMIGDGMGLTTLTAARYHAVGPDGRLHMELLPVTGLMEVTSADKLITDSAACATALSTGVKTENGRISTGPEGAELLPLVARLERAGMASGIVATSRVTHATPAAFAATSESRKREREIAEDLAASGVDVLLGGGRDKFGDSLIEQMERKGYTYAAEAARLDEVASLPLVGLFRDGPLEGSEVEEPSLAQMTATAIRLLDPAPGGFFLMVEGSQIDWGGHDNDEDRIVDQALRFDMAVAEAVRFAAEDGNTLLLVTADHETGGMTIVGGDRDGSDLDVEFSTGHHTAGPVPLFAYGPGAGRFTGLKENTEIGRLLREVLNLEEEMESDVLDTFGPQSDQ